MNIVITGGAGFIGSNAAVHYLKRGDNVVVYDNLSRKGSDENLAWLKSFSGNKPTFIKGSIAKEQDIKALSAYVKRADIVLHFAAQVAVTTSVLDPRADFEANALGTFNLLELMRNTKSRAKLIYCSTNKVYGNMEDVRVAKKATRYAYRDLPQGVSESQLLDFHSPYGCSKGSADQYVHDYGRIYDIDTVVFRQSCIYGPRQFGVEDQGWVAWFMIATVLGKPLTIYGDGKQVRDILYIDDLIAAYDLAVKRKSITRGKIYNIGGGVKNTMSIWKEFQPYLEKLSGHPIAVTYADWRPGDQNVYISDIRKAKEFGWAPKVSVEKGLGKLYHWISTNKDLFSRS